jgi:hypothetical protein
VNWLNLSVWLSWKSLIWYLNFNYDQFF